ncbi:FAD/FMN-containing dehydrogenase [Pseudorhodobacter antarcticus]|uniref:FAD/FMN-containing dehydrogenase n=1 Tax=Pseudorhodobacter antarcticus TaxID=1077947 RepID=A0A1H8F9U4_9RHOB|nr:FAD-binding oxidoreductase [Pseudorhodobacter antarcticus]SEN28335.1 FAD/FMN-containing dehydrogenase [Pseudorhodobacter antarcticus]
MSLLLDLAAVVGDAHVLTGADRAAHMSDWTGKFTADPVAVVRPGDTAQVAACLRVAAAHGVAVVPVSGRTGLVGGAMTVGGLMISVERMNAIREIRPDARIAVVEAGVILDRLHAAAEAEGLYFPLWFGARGSAMIGGVLSTNAGGSNVLRYGSTRALCLGLEVVLADGQVLDLMSELHKDNSGYDLRDLFIGAEGTLGIITAAVMKLVPRPRAYATATVAVRSLPDALVLLNRLREATGGAVEAFEYMPESYMRRLAEARPDIRQPFTPRQPVNILVEMGAVAPRDAVVGADGVVPVAALLEDVLAQMMEDGYVLDAEIARSEAQRRAMWERRELAAEITFAREPTIDTDIAVPLDKVDVFLARMAARLPALDAGAEDICVAHLGDGNVHYTVYPTRDDPMLYDAVVAAVEDEVQALRGSFSAEHGVGLSKRASMARRKDPVALGVMRSIKAALDPDGRMNPGKVIPDLT